MVCVDLLFVVTHSVEHLIIAIMNEQALGHHAHTAHTSGYVVRTPFQKICISN